MNNEFKNYYKILGISQNASSSSIEAAARREMEYANPFQRDLIREAASVLLNDELRARYDVVYNENVDTIERLKQNAISESDFIAISKMDNRIKELEEKKPETKVEESKEEKKPETKVEEEKEEKKTESIIEEKEEKKAEPTVDEEKEETNEEKTEKTDDNKVEEKEQSQQPQTSKQQDEKTKQINDFFISRLSYYRQQPQFKDFNFDINSSNLYNLLPNTLKIIVDQDFKKFMDEQEKRSEMLEKEAAIKATNKKRIRNNALIIGGSTLIAGPLGTLVSTLILKKKGKLKLQKVSSRGRIKEIKTQEIKKIEEYNAKLEGQIEELLNSPLKDNQSRYKLEIAKLRYQNQIDLLEARIKFKKEQKGELGSKVYNRLYVLGLEMCYATSIMRLGLCKKKAEAKLKMLNSYNPNPEKKDRLTKLQGKIEAARNEVNEVGISDVRKNHRAAKLNRLDSKKLQKIKKMSLKKNGISRRQVALALFNSPKNWFSHDEKQTEEFVDLNSFSGKTH